MNNNQKPAKNEQRNPLENSERILAAIRDYENGKKNYAFRELPD